MSKNETPEDKAVYQRAGKRTTHALSGQTIPIPPLFILMTKSVIAALILRQSIYLSTSNEADNDGWFCVPYAVWESDYGLTKAQIRGAIDGGKKTTGLLQLGLETDVRKEWRGSWRSTAPKNHYRVNFDKLEVAITNFESEKKRQSEKLTIQESKKSGLTTLYVEKEKNPADAESPSKKSSNGQRSFKQLENDRRHELAKVMAWHHLEREPTIKEINAWRGRKDTGVIGKLADAHPELMPDIFRAFLEEDYEMRYGQFEDAGKLEAFDTINRRLTMWLAAQSPADARQTEQWQTHAVMYEAYIRAFPHFAPEDLLQMELIGLLTWWDEKQRKTK